MMWRRKRRERSKREHWMEDWEEESERREEF